LSFVHSVSEAESPWRYRAKTWRKVLPPAIRHRLAVDMDIHGYIHVWIYQTSAILWIYPRILCCHIC